MSLKNTTTQMLHLLLSPLHKSPLSLRNNLHGSKLHLALLCSSLRTKGTNLSHNLKLYLLYSHTKCVRIQTHNQCEHNHVLSLLALVG